MRDEAKDVGQMLTDSAPARISMTEKLELELKQVYQKSEQLEEVIRKLKANPGVQEVIDALHKINRY